MNLLLCSAVFFPMTCAVIGYVIGRKNKNVRDYFADIVTGAEFGLFLYLFINTVMNGSSQIEVEISGVCGFGLHFTLDGFRALYGTIAAFMWFMSTLFSKEYFAHYRNRNR